MRMRMTFSLYLPVPPVRGHGPEVLDRRGSVAQDLPNRGEEREAGGGGGEKEKEGGRVHKDRIGPRLREEGEREER